MKTVKFYNICIDEAAVEKQGDDPLKKLIDDMGGWNVTGNMTSLLKMSITQRLGRVSSELFCKPFVDIKVFIDPHDSNKHILQVSLAFLGTTITKSTHKQICLAFMVFSVFKFKMTSTFSQSSNKKRGGGGGVGGWEIGAHVKGGCSSSLQGV